MLLGKLGQLILLNKYLGMHFVIKQGAFNFFARIYIIMDKFSFKLILLKFFYEN
ncbi:hypothetical protein CNEO4_1350037 [Clostridium neonatale]|uniref:Uncharacterized protein n=1 Tax=Clostridium neonatale TaxID=137838 RepID=A0AA86JK18_9CLOT|nr:hypothetical protein CNEO_1160036 [Clostridium neonatale]CAG9706540.1 hypothetical protein CNEO_42510 [Clostridium neonatale]CAG9712967.1 hypothetical protein CNEO_500154 [Clostridium neonatale]CAI3195985.1 hypothetical protein CNEO2_140005 [Clostridium neonatale]CAI3199753.1 hypothetical protein CNEO2_10115 [Clostridium neonatale]